MKYLGLFLLSFLFSSCYIYRNNLTYEFNNGIKAEEIFIETNSGITVVINGRNGHIGDYPISSDIFLKISNSSRDTLFLLPENFNMISEEYEITLIAHNIPAYIAPENGQAFQLRYLAAHKEDYKKNSQGKYETADVLFEIKNTFLGDHTIKFKVSDIPRLILY